MTRFLHAADLHIDSPLMGLSAYPGAPVEAIRGATRRALESLVELAIAERVGAVLIAGDVYDGDWRDFSTGLYFRAQMARLHEAGIEVVLIHGNHDAASVLTRHLSLPHVHVLSAQAPQTVVLESVGLAVHGQSFATRAVLENLAAQYPAPVPGLVNVGLLHSSLTGAPGHDSYAPAELGQLIAHGYDYWALGHIHERAVLHTDPWVVYSGNLQGRHARETGAKGATLVTVGEDGLSVEARTLDHVRWARVNVDVGGAADETVVLEAARVALERAVVSADGRLLAARLELSGMTGAVAALTRERERLDSELRALATDLGFERIWLERIVWSLSAPRSSAVPEESLGVALSVLARAGDDPDTLSTLAESLRPLAQKLPTALRSGPEAIDPTDPDTLARLLGEAQELLSGRLAEAVA